MSIEFLLTSLVILVAPGTGVLYTLAAALSWGARTSIVAAFACTLGIVPHLLAVVPGLAALLHTSAAVLQIVKFAGGLSPLHGIRSPPRARRVADRHEGAPRFRHSSRPRT
jgi:threonine/homoserine/homoserine lactone efflux protein